MRASASLSAASLQGSDEPLLPLLPMGKLRDGVWPRAQGQRACMRGRMFTVHPSTLWASEPLGEGSKRRTGSKYPLGTAGGGPQTEQGDDLANMKRARSQHCLNRGSGKLFKRSASALRVGAPSAVTGRQRKAGSTGWSTGAACSRWWSAPAGSVCGCPCQHCCTHGRAQLCPAPRSSDLGSGWAERQGRKETALWGPRGLLSLTSLRDPHPPASLPAARLS